MALPVQPVAPAMPCWLCAQGGLALGEAVKSSGLLENIASNLSSVVTGWPVWPVLATFAALVLVFTTIISHTVSRTAGRALTVTRHTLPAPCCVELLIRGCCTAILGVPLDHRRSRDVVRPLPLTPPPLLPRVSCARWAP